MPVHYTKNTLECTVWCAKCRRMTQHRVDGGRQGPCLECKPSGMTKAQEKRKISEEKEKSQTKLPF